jgi:hypothetical protein
MAGRRPNLLPKAHFDGPPPHLPFSARSQHHDPHLAHSIVRVEVHDPPTIEENRPRKQNYQGGLKLQPKIADMP